MNDHARRYVDASTNLRNKFLDPITGLLAATAAFVSDANQRASQAETKLEVLQAAAKQSLGEIYAILEVDNHAEAMARIRFMLGMLSQ